MCAANGAADRKAKRRVVAIVGTSPTSRLMANREPADVEIWGLQSTETFLDRCDRVFEMHGPGITDFSDEKSAFDRTCGVPVYVVQPDHGLPTGVLYPFAEVGINLRAYWSNTISYMLALAVYEGVDEIHLWGCDMATGTEHEKERPGVEYWLGVAEGRGIALTLPDSSPLLRVDNGAYGLVPRPGVKKTELVDILADLERQRLKAGDPDLLVALSGATQITRTILGRVEPRLKNIPIEYVGSVPEESVQ